MYPIRLASIFLSPSLVHAMVNWKHHHVILVLNGVKHLDHPVNSLTLIRIRPLKEPASHLALLAACPQLVKLTQTSIHLTMSFLVN